MAWRLFCLITNVAFQIYWWKNYATWWSKAIVVFIVAAQAAYFVAMYV